MGTIKHNLKPFDITTVVWKVPEVMSTVLSKEQKGHNQGFKNLFIYMKPRDQFFLCSVIAFIIKFELIIQQNSSQQSVIVKL